jgi:oligopeptide/dipeptide ABC transporter ATP-binding protein
VACRPDNARSRRGPRKTGALLDVRALTVDYLTPRGPARAVDHVSFSLAPGEIVGLAGERLVLYAGQLMEAAPSEELMPDPGAGLRKRRVEARGEIPVVISPKPGCRFANRCPHAVEICREGTPSLVEVRPNRRVRCYLYGSHTPAEVNWV